MQNSVSNSTNIQQKLCLATVSNKEYWPGTYVMIKSFLKYNSWFKGDIVIITNNKAYIQQKLIKHGLEFIIAKPSEILINAINKVSRTADYLKAISDRFLKFEIFRLLEYDNVIYFDSDILHINEISSHQIIKNELIAVQDPSFFRGFFRDKKTMQKIPIDNSKDNVYTNFINSGFIVLGKKYLNTEIYTKLITSINSIEYSKFIDKLADEPVLNFFFENSFVMATHGYNCSIHLLIKNTIPDNICVIHFTGKNKPWKIKSWLRLTFRNTGYFKYLARWLSEYYSRK